MAVYLALTVVLNTVFASCYKVAVRRNCNLQAVNVWVYVGSASTVLAYILLRGRLAFSASAMLLGAASGFMAYFATLSFFHHMKRGQLSVSWTVISLSVGFPVLASIFLWSEHPSTKQTVGLGLIVAALILFGRHETSRNGQGSMVHGQCGEQTAVPSAIGHRPFLSLILLMVAFVLTGVLNIINKGLIQWNLGAHKDLYMLAFYGSGIIVGTAVLLSRRQATSGTDRSVGFVMGFAGALSLLCLLIALEYLPGIVVFPVRNLGNLALTGFVSILAWRERLSRSQWLGIALSLLAIWLIY